MPERKTVHRLNPASGTQTTHTMSAIDAKDAVRRFPSEYSYKAWPSDAEKAARAAKDKELAAAKKRVAEAEAKVKAEKGDKAEAEKELSDAKAALAALQGG